MAELLEQDLVPGAAVDRECNLVAHRARRQKQCRLFAEELGHGFLEQIDGGIFPKLLVPDFRFTHEPAHGCRGTGDRVAEQIDRYHSILSTVRRAIRSGIMVAAAQVATTIEPTTTSSAVVCPEG
jgi:hypothetical protein